MSEPKVRQNKVSYKDTLKLFNDITNNYQNKLNEQKNNENFKHFSKQNTTK